MEAQDEVKIFLTKILSSWKLIIASVVICVGLAFVLVRYQTPMYKVTAKLLVEDEKKGGDSFDATELLEDRGDLLSVKSNVDNELEILKTKTVTEKAVKALTLNVTYYKKGIIKNLQLYEAPFKIEIVKENKNLRPIALKFSTIDRQTMSIEYKDRVTNELVVKSCKYGNEFVLKDVGNLRLIRNTNVPFEGENYMVTISTVDEAINSLQKAMSIVVSNKLVTTIELTLNSSLPEQGEEILDKFIAGYIQQAISDKNVVVDSTIALIENRLLLVGDELRQIEENIQQFKQTNNLADLSEQARVLVNSNTDYTKELADLETRLSIIEDLRTDLKDKMIKVIPSSGLPSDMVFTRLIESYNLLLQEREKLLLSTTEQNPYVKNIDLRIAEQRKTLVSNLDATKKSTEISLTQLRKKVSELGGEIKNIPVHERTYLGLFRQQTLKQELYLYLLQKREEIALSKTSNIANSKIIDFPKAETKPYSPNKLIILSIGFILGILFPIGFIYARESLNNKVQTKEDILKGSNISVIGEIGFSDGSTDFSPKSILSEQFRALRTNLSFYTKNQENIILLITSNTKGEGKTFVTINLAKILALSGKKVLLVDLDLRMASLSTQLKMKDKNGFSNYISSSTNEYVQYINQVDGVENLYVLPAGVLPANPVEMLLNRKTDELLLKIKESYDYVVIDSPPIGLVTDSLILTRLANVTLYVVRQNYSLKEDLKTLHELEANKMVEKLAVIFNDIKQVAGKAYGYGRYEK